MNDARQAFGLTLRTHREQLGITLSDIAESTKISVALLSALERGDVSRWPKGIFRRSFLREYVVAIGLSPEPLLREFVRLFRDESVCPPTPAPPAEFRLALVTKDTAPSLVLRRVATVVAELGAVAFVGTASTWIVGVDTVSGIAFTALAYYPVANLLFERKMGIRGLRALANTPMAAGNAEGRRYDEIERREELGFGVS